MCGIAGIISTKEKALELEKMLDVQSHRGPDNKGKFEDPGFAYIGHNRLSIIDLNPSANQPFADSSGRYQLTFNGEIYNYKEIREELRSDYNFQTQSDTEVLLAAYLYFGKDCLNKLNGMFSFAIWDSKLKELFAARDRFGVKPFFYLTKGEDFYFASEIKTLKIIKRQLKPNQKVWANYFAYGSYGLPNETFFKNVYQLPAGHYLIKRHNTLEINRWYDFVGNVGKIEINDNFEDVKNIYLELLKNSVSLRFRADVNVGFNISGGLDSSLLLALVNSHTGFDKIKAYTFFTGDKKYDELPWVEKMIAITGNPLSKIKFSSNEVKLTAPRVSYFEDEPFGGVPTLAYSKIFEQARIDNVRVLLDGQGMDEQWAGYDYYRESLNTSTIQGQSDLYSPFKINCLSSEMIGLTEKPHYPEPFNNSLQNKQYRDLFFTKIPRALRFNDRISMSFGTELREPFLDHRLVEYAFAQPDKFKIRGDIHKYLLRELINNIVPQDISCAPKRPLQTPQREWLGDDLKEWVENKIKKIFKSEYNTWFDEENILIEWQVYKQGNNSSSFHIWQWINFVLIMESGINEYKR